MLTFDDRTIVVLCEQLWKSCFGVLGCRALGVWYVVLFLTASGLKKRWDVMKIRRLYVGAAGL